MVIQSEHERYGRSAAFLTGMSSPIALELMSDPELNGQFAFYGTASTEASAENVAAFMEEEGVAGAVAVCDIGKAGITGWYQDTVDDHGTPSLIIHNAGDPVVGAFDELTTDDARRAMEVNFYPFVDFAHLAKDSLANARQRGEPGLLLGVSTLGATAHALPGQTAYGPSKKALDGFAETMAAERKFAAAMGLAENSLPWVRVLRVGAADTKMFRDNAPPPVQEMVAATDMLLSPKEVAMALKIMIDNGDTAPNAPVLAFTGGLLRLLNDTFRMNVAEEPELPRLS
jgi:NAD(P)-dependent dehydrogenase (short-subunit alcohol dehydrogenase family)